MPLESMIFILYRYGEEGEPVVPGKKRKRVLLSEEETTYNKEYSSKGLFSFTALRNEEPKANTRKQGERSDTSKWAGQGDRSHVEVGSESSTYSLVPIFS